MIRIIESRYEVKADGLIHIKRSDSAPLTPFPIERLKTALVGRGFTSADRDGIYRQVSTSGEAAITIELSGEGICQFNPSPEALAKILARQGK